MRKKISEKMKNLSIKVKKLFRNSDFHSIDTNKMHYFDNKLTFTGNVQTWYNKSTENLYKRGGEFMYKALDVAKYVITKCAKEGYPISNLQLQKILYTIQGEYLAEKNSPLFQESISAWQYGPVVPEVYYIFCGYGGTKIRSIYEDIQIDESVSQFINPIIEQKRAISPWVLVEETHREGKAWHKTYQEGRGAYSEIPQSLIREDFKR